MFNKSKFYELAKELRGILKCGQETAEYLAALYQWVEQGVSTECYELRREAGVFDRLPDCRQLC